MHNVPSRRARVNVRSLPYGTVWIAAAWVCVFVAERLLNWN